VKLEPHYQRSVAPLTSAWEKHPLKVTLLVNFGDLHYSRTWSIFTHEPIACQQITTSTMRLSSSLEQHSLEEIMHNQKLTPPLSTEPGHRPSTTLQSTKEIPQAQPTTSQEAADDDQVKYPSGIHLLTVTLALVLALLLAVMDMTILATAIPHITDEFHSLDDIGWYASVFFMTVASTQSTWGKAYKYFDLETVFLIAIAVFELGSLICGKPSSAPRIDGYVQADVI